MRERVLRKMEGTRQEEARGAKGAKTESQDAKKGLFTEEEKRILNDAQKELGNKWAEIAERLPGRSRKQVKNWWHNHHVQREREGGLPKEGRFSEEERKIVMDAQKELGNKWAEIAERLPGRSRKQVQDHWHKRLHAQRHRERMTHNQPRAIEGPFTDEEKKIVMDAQRELGNKWTQIAELLPGRSGKQVNSWWRSQIKSEKRKRKRMREEEGSATPDPPPEIGSEREKAELQEGKVGGMSLSEGGGAPKDDIESVDAHDSSPRNGASGELDGPREEGQCVGIAKQIIAQIKRQMAEITNPHALQNINGMAFEQTMQMYLHQWALRGDGMTHELMVDAIDQAIAQEVQRAALANELHAPPMMAEKDRQTARMERIIAEKDIETMHLKSKECDCSLAKKKEA